MPVVVEPRLVLVALAALAALAAIVQSVRLSRLRSAPGRALRARADRAALGERRAERLLVEMGFAIVARQVTASAVVFVDGRPVPFEVRADLVVERARRTFVAEVKTGELAPRIESSATRRQLLEYNVAFDADGVLLVDADRGRVHEIAFPRRQAAPHYSRGALVAWIVAAAAVALAFLR